MPHATLQLYLRRLEVCLLHRWGSWEQMHAIIDAIKADWDHQAPSLADTLIADLPLDVLAGGIRFQLDNRGIETVAQLVALPVVDLLEFRQVGRKTISQIRRLRERVEAERRQQGECLQGTFPEAEPPSERVKRCKCD